MKSQQIALIQKKLPKAHVRRIILLYVAAIGKPMETNAMQCGRESLLGQLEAVNKKGVRRNAFFIYSTVTDLARFRG